MSELDSNTLSPLIRIDKIEQHNSPTSNIDISEILKTIHRLGDYINNGLQDILHKMDDNSATDIAIIKENDYLKKQLQDILSGATLPPEIQKQIDEVFSKIQDNKTKIQKAIDDTNKKSL